MNIQKIVNLCKKSGTLYLYNAKDCQWISNGYAVYPMYGVPQFDEDSICATYGISDEQKEKMVISEKRPPESGISFEDNEETEIPAKVISPGIVYAGTDYMTVSSEKGIEFIKRKYLDVFDESVELNVRTLNDRTYIAIKQGMFLKGIILPETTLRATIVSEIKDLVKEL